MCALLVLPTALLLATPAAAQPAKVPEWFTKAVQKVDAAFDPPAAKPGQAVTLRLTVKLADGYNTYPTKQVDKAAAGMVNLLTFPTDGPLVFVGAVEDPADFQEKAEPELMIARLRYLTGEVVYTRRAVVLPSAPPGAVAVKPTLKLTVCDAKNCYPGRALTPEATLTVLPGPAVPVDEKYADEVKAAGK